MKATTGGLSVILGVGLLAASAGIATAQQPSITRTTQTGQPSSATSTRVVKATVVSVNGNKVVGEDASGKATEYTIPEGFKFQFEGKDIGVADLKPGMHVTATITDTTTTTPVYVTEIRTGKVLAVSGDSIIVRGPQGNRVFTTKDVEKRNARIMSDGKEVQLHALRVGNNITAVIVTDEPPRVVSEREAQAMVKAAPQAPAAAEAPAAAPAAAPTEVPAAPAAAPAAAPTEAVAEPPAAAPTEAAAAPAPAATTETTETTSRFPSWLLWVVLLIVVIIVVMLIRRKKS